MPVQCPFVGKRAWSGLASTSAHDPEPPIGCQFCRDAQQTSSPIVIASGRAGGRYGRGKGGPQEANMSLDNTSHPGRPGPDELVPSRYALRVGEIDVLVVSDGVITLPGAMLAHNADPAVRAAWLDDMFQPPDVLDWALNVVVVRSGGRTILVDAGLGMEYPDLPRARRNRRGAGGHSPVVPVRLPCGGRRQRLSLGTGLLGLLTACSVRAELDDRMRLNNWSIAA